MSSDVNSLGSETPKERRFRVRRNAAAIAKYLEFGEVLRMKGTAGSSFNLEVVESQSESTVPMSEKGHLWHSDGDNAHFFRHVLPILRAIEKQEAYKPALLLEHDPTALRRWRAGERENDRAWMERFDKLCMYVAKLLENRRPGIAIRCNINPRLDEKRAKTREAQKKGTAYSDGIIVSKIEEIEREEGPMERKAAEALLSDREGYSIPRIRWAVKRKNQRTKQGESSASEAEEAS